MTAERVPIDQRCPARCAGSIDSQTIVIGAREARGASSKGVVRPYSTKQIPFYFRPTFHNKGFKQHITVNNILNSSAELVVEIKAVVKKPQSFEVHTSELDFGPTLVNERSKTLRLILTNTTHKQKYYTLEAVLEKLEEHHKFRTDMYFQLDMIERAQVDEKTVESTEEKVDVLEQQIKKMKRKGKRDKVTAAEKELRRLKSILDQGNSGSESEGDAFDSLSDSEDEDSGDERLEKIRGQVLTRANKKNELKFKNDARPRRNGITFTLKQHSMQVIFVTFVARRLEQGLPPNMPSVRETAKLVSGIVHVSETKNVDIAKDIEVMATVCPTNDAFLQVIGSLDMITWTPTMKDLPQKRQLLPKEKHRGEHQVSSLKKAASVERTSAPKLSSVIYATPARVDMGRVTVLQEASGTFKLCNSSASPQNFIALSSEEAQGGSRSEKKKTVKKTEGDKKGDKKQPVSIKVVPNGGVVPPNGALTITVYYTPRASGRSEHSLLIRNLRNGGQRDLQIAVTANASHPEYIRNMEVEANQTGKENEAKKLNFGECYIDKSMCLPTDKYAKAAPFTLLSVHDSEVNVLVKSNLPRQVFVFYDADLQSPALEPVKLAPRKTLTFYIALRPAAIELGLTHVMVGGIGAEIQSADGNQLHVEHYQFRCKMTMSSLRLSTNSLDLGAAESLGKKISGTFVIENLTEQMPVDFEIVKPVWAFVRPLTGRLMGKYDKETGSARTHFKIQFSVAASAYGYLSEQIVVINKMCRSQQLVVEIKLFVDDMTMKTDLPYQNGISVLALEPVYIYAPLIQRNTDGAEKPEKGAGKRFDWDKAVVETNHTDFTLYNNVDTAITGLQPLANIDVSVMLHSKNSHQVKLVDGLMETESRPLTVPKDGDSVHPDAVSCLERSSVSGENFDMEAGQISQMRCSFHGVKRDALTLGALQKLRKGNTIPVEGLLTFKRTITPSMDSVCTCPLPWHLDTCSRLEFRVAKAIHLQATAGMSLGKLVDKNLHLGLVGIISSWEPVDFTFSIQNQCEIPLAFTVISLPSCFTLGIEAGTVAGLSTLECSGTLRPLDLQYLSSHSWKSEIVISNDHNPFNSMKLNVSADVMTTLLQFTRVAENSISMPPLAIPDSSGHLGAIDQWFVVENISEMPLELHLTTKLNEDVGSILSFDVKSRSSSIKLTKVKLYPSEEVEIRLVARPQKGVRVVPPSCLPQKQAAGEAFPEPENNSSGKKLWPTESSPEQEIDLACLTSRLYQRWQRCTKS